MSPLRLALGAVIMLLAVVGATAASGLLLERDPRRVPDRELADLVYRAFTLHASTLDRELEAACERDLSVERLALELAAGGTGEGAERTALSLARASGGEFAIFLVEGNEARALGESSSDAAPSSISPQALEAASERPLAIERNQRWLSVQTCSRAEGERSLWLAHAEPIEGLFEAIVPQSRILEVLASASDHAEDDVLGRAHILTFDDEQDRPTLTLWLTTPIAGLGAWSLAPLALLATALGALLAYQFARNKQIADAVLAELEAAAKRVAMGDLSSRIERRVGGRADQTFQTFDRMTEELREMRTRLAEAERAHAWEEIARRIAHEIKNPLSPIQIAIETLRKAHAKRLPVFDEIFEESTRTILDEVRRIEHIVREFSEFARLPKPRPGVLELGALVEDTVGLYRPSDVQVEIEKPAHALEVRVDREQIAQVLVNLLQNAFAAARENTVPRVLVVLERVAGNDGKGLALLHVDDNGSGVSESDRARIFEPYYTTKSQGAGLGLAIARRIAIDHQGSLQASASPLGGARFTLKLDSHPGA